MVGGFSYRKEFHWELSEEGVNNIEGPWLSFAQSQDWQVWVVVSGKTLCCFSLLFIGNSSLLGPYSSLIGSINGFQTKKDFIICLKHSFYVSKFWHKLKCQLLVTIEINRF